MFKFSAVSEKRTLKVLSDQVQKNTAKWTHMGKYQNRDWVGQDSTDFNELQLHEKKRLNFTFRR